MILLVSMVLLGFVCCVIGLATLVKREMWTGSKRCSTCTCLSCTLSGGFDSVIRATSQGVHDMLVWGRSLTFVLAPSAPVLEEPKTPLHDKLPFGSSQKYDTVPPRPNYDAIISFPPTRPPPSSIPVIHRGTTHLQPIPRLRKRSFDLTPFDVSGSARFSLALAGSTPAAELPPSPTRATAKRSVRRHCTPELARELHLNFVGDAYDDADASSVGESSVDEESMPGTPPDRPRADYGYFGKQPMSRLPLQPPRLSLQFLGDS